MSNRLNLSGPRLRLTRTGIFVILAILVALLGAAAKHSQYDGAPHHGYLSKAVKMASARASSESSTELAQHLSAPLAPIPQESGPQAVPIAPSATGFIFIALLSPPLRV